MKTEEITSCRSALRHLARGDNRASRVRLAVILLAWVLYLSSCAVACALAGLVLASWLM